MNSAAHAPHAIIFSTYWYGNALSKVAHLALLAWQRWGETLSADPEVRMLMGSWTLFKGTNDGQGI